MGHPRPDPVGFYELLTDFDSLQMSVRVFRLGDDAQRVELHRHRRSTQVYVALDGEVTVYRDGVPVVLRPYEALEIPPHVIHGAHAADGEAIVMNISVPPLAADDQSPLADEPHHIDLDLPASDLDVDD